MRSADAQAGGRSRHVVISAVGVWWGASERGTIVFIGADAGNE